MIVKDEVHACNRAHAWSNIGGLGSGLSEVEALGIGGVGAELRNGRAETHERVQHFLEMKAFSMVQSGLLRVGAVQWCAGNAENLPQDLLSLLFSGLLALLKIFDQLVLLAGSLLLLEESAAKAALELLEVAGRLWNAGLSVSGNNVLLMIIVDIVWSKETGWCERLVADHAIAGLEARLRNVEIAGGRLLLLHGGLILLSEHEAGLLEEHVW